MDYLGVLAQLNPITRHPAASMPKIAERTTGEVMGESAERMAQRNEITREAQDEFAERSHHARARAIAAAASRKEVVPVTTPTARPSTRRHRARRHQREKLGKLQPVFAKDGTRDRRQREPAHRRRRRGALMSEEKARALGLHSRSPRSGASATSGVDPADQLLIGPAIAMPKAARPRQDDAQDDRLVDMHEAFARRC
jgi:acetyl-CoA acyltransferase